jgi:hypothetical protein
MQVSFGDICLRRYEWNDARANAPPGTTAPTCGTNDNIVRRVQAKKAEGKVQHVRYFSHFCLGTWFDTKPGRGVWADCSVPFLLCPGL